MFNKEPEVILEPPPHKHMWEKWEKDRVTELVASGTETTFVPYTPFPGTGNPSTYPITNTKYIERQVAIQERRCTICGFYERQVLGYL